MKLLEIIKTKETDAFPFRPNNKFYNDLGISKKRFGLILRNEKTPTLEELQKICLYFNLKITDLI